MRCNQQHGFLHVYLATFTCKTLHLASHRVFRIEKTHRYLQSGVYNKLRKRKSALTQKSTFLYHQISLFK